jgi:5-methylcytosine-specific restriction enzyme subunit McrC
MRTETVTESQDARLQLTERQAECLREAGSRLASKRQWWGNEGEARVDRSVIRCSALGGDSWRVRISDAIGVVAIPDLQILVQPKIPLPHLLHLFASSGHLPRLDAERAALAMDDSFWTLVARWYVQSVEILLRNDLIRDYRITTDTLQLVKGHLDPVGTARLYYKGNHGIPCTYDEFDTDNPFNRIVLAALRGVAASELLSFPLRKRAAQLILRVEGVGPLQPTDLSVELDPRTGYYADALALARHILTARGRTLRGGAERGWAFLIRTPEMVEEGLRVILAESLRPKFKVAKKGLQLTPSKLTLNPDLVFDDGRAIADVKYKITPEDWSRPDLYQVVAFAAGYRTRHAALVSFSPSSEQVLPTLDVGDVRVSHLPWPAEARLSPEDAACALVLSVGEWLEAVPAAARVA